MTLNVISSVAKGNYIWFSAKEKLGCFNPSLVPIEHTFNLWGVHITLKVQITHLKAYDHYGDRMPYHWFGSTLQIYDFLW